MEAIIKLLPESLANQIAAGEVVQRPASVVKELLENSIDAKATHIQLIVEQAGKSSIQVIDNGMGMSVVDARMAFERHATSKIAQLEDLFQIRSLGFRGEALASIAAVAHVTLKTRREDDTLGSMIKIEGGVLKSQSQCNCPVGTSINVEHLFFNVPARRNFLKSNAVEFKHIIDQFLRVALSCDSIGWDLLHNDNQIFNLSAQSMKNRILAIFPEFNDEELLAVGFEEDEVSVSGFVGIPHATSKDKSEQYLFVNRRFVKSAYLHHAIMQAYSQALPTGKQPIYFIYIQVAPQTIDINIHPTKTEIKFEQEQMVYQAVFRAVRSALFGTASGAPSRQNIAFSDTNVSLDPKYPDFLQPNASAPLEPFIKSEQAQTPPSALDTLAEFTGIHIKDKKTNTSSNQSIRTRLSRAWDYLKSELESDIDSPIFPNPVSQTFSEPVRNQSTSSNQEFSNRSTSATKPENYSQNEMGDIQVLGQMPSGYVILMLDDEIIIMDSMAVQKSITRLEFESYLSTPERLVPSQQLLFPIHWTFGQSNQVELSSFLEVLQRFGFNIEATKSELCISAIPAIVNLSAEQLFSFLEHSWETCAQLDSSQYASSLQKELLSVAHVPEETLHPKSIQSILDRWQQLGSPQYSPDGALLVWKITSQEIKARMLKKSN